jgi:hypothetical protein
MVTGLLRGIGHVTDVCRIFKHSREEILREHLQLPWRRSPLWLLIRVALQLVFERLGNELGRYRKPLSLYKHFMVFLMSTIVNKSALQSLSHDLLFVMTAKISRRLLKLGPAEEATWLRYTEKAIIGIESKLKRKWDLIQSSARYTLDLSALSTLDFGQDTLLAMDTLRPYLEEISKHSSAEIPKAQGIYGPPFQRNEARDLPNVKFSQDRELAFFELADFESGVETNLETHRIFSSEQSTHRTPSNIQPTKRISGDELPDFTGPSSIGGTFAAEDLVKGFHIHTVDPADTDDPEDKWRYITDNSFSREFLKRVDAFDISSQQPSSFSGLCERCSNVQVLDPDFELYLSLPGLRKTADSCALCRTLHRVLQPSGPIYPIRPIRVYRGGSNLIADGRDRPVLRICADQEWTEADDIQVGFPKLPEAGSPVHYKLLHEWLRVCDEEHREFRCHGESDVQLPTRVIDVGQERNPGVLRLHCTKQSDRGEYIALSHCWGTPAPNERVKNYTFTSNIGARCKSIDFDNLGKTFQHAIMSMSHARHPLESY